jgi:hypothetical protein
LLKVAVAAIAAAARSIGFCCCNPRVLPTACSTDAWPAAAPCANAKAQQNGGKRSPNNGDIGITGTALLLNLEEARVNSLLSA